MIATATYKCDQCQQLDLSDRQAAADAVGWCQVSKQYRHSMTERRCEFFMPRRHVGDGVFVTGGRKA